LRLSILKKEHYQEANLLIPVLHAMAINNVN
jgi:hypothetical protein